MRTRGPNDQRPGREELLFGSFRGLLLLVLWTPAAGLLAQDTTAAGANAPLGTEVVAGGRQLANQANDPTAPLTTLQLRDIIALPASGWTSAGNLLEIQPVFPFAASKYIPFDQLARVTFPIVSTPGPGGTSGFGDIDFFDMFLVGQKWGRWGFGPTMVFPTASQTALGAGKWQLGPVVGIIVSKVPNMQIGLLLENPISFAGDSSRPPVNALSITPTLTYNFEGGWFGGLGDFVVSFNWEDNGAATIPIGLQVGKLVKVARRHFLVSIEGGEVLTAPGNNPPGWLIGLEVTWIVKAHVFKR